MLINSINSYATTKSVVNQKNRNKQKEVLFKGAFGEELVKNAFEKKGFPPIEHIMDKITTLRGISYSRAQDVIKTLCLKLESLIKEVNELSEENKALKKEVNELMNKKERLILGCKTIIDGANLTIKEKDLEIASLKETIDELRKSK